MRQVLIGELAGCKVAGYPLVIKLPCRRIGAWPLLGRLYRSVCCRYWLQSSSDLAISVEDEHI